MSADAQGNPAPQTSFMNDSYRTSTMISDSFSDWFNPQQFAGESTAVTTLSCIEFVATTLVP